MAKANCKTIYIPEEKKNKKQKNKKQKKKKNKKTKQKNKKKKTTLLVKIEVDRQRKTSVDIIW